MLRRVAGGVVGESLRLYTPDPALLFSSLDARRPGYPRALELAERAGFTPVIRLAGGQAAAFLERSIAFAWASQDADAHLHIRSRFERLTNWIADSLRQLGLDARVGEIPGEYCPGEFSVNIAGRVKVMGLGQRVIRGGAHVGGVLTVGQTELLRQTLAPIYEALGLDFRAETAGSIGDFDSSLDCDDIMTALVDGLRELGYIERSQQFDDAIIREAELLAAVHDPKAEANDRRGLGAILRANPRSGKTIVQDEPR